MGKAKEGWGVLNNGFKVHWGGKQWTPGSKSHNGAEAMKNQRIQGIAAELKRTSSSRRLKILSRTVWISGTSKITMKLKTKGRMQKCSLKCVGVNYSLWTLEGIHPTF